MAACSDREAQTSATLGRSLLVCGPDEVLDQVGDLRPGGDGWDRAAFDGWIVEKGAAWTLVDTGRLSIGALRPEDRTLSLDLIGPASPAPEAPEAEERQTLAVRLNGSSLHEGTVPPGRFRLDLDAPRGLWERGHNLVEIEVKPLLEHKDGVRGVGLERLSYDEPRTVTLDRDPALVDAGCGLRYRLSTAERSVLLLRGESRSAGAIHVVLGWMSPEDGAVEKPVSGSTSLRCESGVGGGVVPLPASSDGRVLEVEVAWLPDDGTSKLELDQLSLVDPAAEGRPNVVFLSIDTLAARHMSVYGYERSTTPNLERLAREAITFDACKSSAPWTIPSYMSQFTGLHPRANRMPVERGGRRPNEWELEQIAPNRWTLAEALRAAGYATAGFVDNPWLGKGFGFQQGFEHYDISASLIGVEDPEGGFRMVAENALDWLDERPDERPFFLFAQGLDPHGPYFTQAPWAGSFADASGVDREHLARTGVFPLFTFDVVPSHIAWQMIGPPLPRMSPTAPIVDAYDEKILEVDAAIGFLLDELERRGLYDDALILVSADHGEAMTEHDHLFGHGLLFEEHLHVPLMVRMPRGERGGTRISASVQLLDIYPSLVELLEIPLSCESLHGTARILDHVRGRTPRSDPPLFAEGWFMEQISIEHDGWKLILLRPWVAKPYVRTTSPYVDREELHRLIPELADPWITEERLVELVEANPSAVRYLKQTLDRHHPHLYYLPDDPGEERNLAETYPGIVQALSVMLAEEGRVAEESAAVARFLPTRTELTEAETEEMRALGYAGD